MSKIKLEVVCTNIESVIAARLGGADRIELCENLAEGGTTPGYGMIQVARTKLPDGLFVMIRPRGGDFLYSDDEFEIMKKDIEICKQLKVDGVVFGLLNTDGSVDKSRTAELVNLAQPMPVTFHRAFDLVSDPVKALEDIIECGCRRILTSGQKSTALEGADLISKLIQLAGNRTIILPGGGIRPENVDSLLQATHAVEIHSSARASRQSKMNYKRDDVQMGNNTMNEYNISIVDLEMVKNLKKIVSEF